MLFSKKNRADSIRPTKYGSKYLILLLIKLTSCRFLSCENALLSINSIRLLLKFKQRRYFKFTLFQISIYYI